MNDKQVRGAGQRCEPESPSHFVILKVSFMQGVKFSTKIHSAG